MRTRSICEDWWQLQISKGSDALSRATFQIGVQSGVIIIIHLTSMLSYCECHIFTFFFSILAFQILQFIPASAINTMLYFAHFGWMLVHGKWIDEYLTRCTCKNQFVIKNLIFKVNISPQTSGLSIYLSLIMCSFVTSYFYYRNALHCLPLCQPDYSREGAWSTETEKACERGGQHREEPLTQNEWKLEYSHLSCNFHRQSVQILYKAMLPI